jgi:hypothetical protein
MVIGVSLAWAVSIDYHGIPHQTVGSATAAVQGAPPNDQLVVSNIGSSGQDGVVADLLDIPGVKLHEGLFDFSLDNDGQTFEFDYSFLNLDPMKIRMQEEAARTPPKLYVADSPGRTVDVELLLNDTQLAILIDRNADPSDPLLEGDGVPSGSDVEVKETGEFDVIWTLSFELPVTLETLPGQQSYMADKIIVKRKRNGGNKTTVATSAIQSVSMTAKDIPSFTVVDESYVATTVLPTMHTWGLVLSMFVIGGGASLMIRRRRRARR